MIDNGDVPKDGSVSNSNATLDPLDRLVDATRLLELLWLFATEKGAPSIVPQGCEKSIRKFYVYA
jgi:hypothetical protein